MLFWIESQPTPIIALIIFSLSYLAALAVFLAAVWISRLPIAKEVQPIAPGILAPLGALLGILIAFLAARVWTNLDPAEEYIGHEIGALREATLLVQSLPPDLEERIRAATKEHVALIVSTEWPAMADGRETFRWRPVHLEQAINALLSFAPTASNQQLAQRRALVAFENALEYRRYRVRLSGADIDPIQWVVVVLLSGTILITIATIHIGQRWPMAAGLFVCSTAIAICFVLLTEYDRPFGRGGFVISPAAYLDVLPQ